MKIAARSTMLLTVGALVGAMGVMAFRPGLLPVPSGSGVVGISPAEAALLQPVGEIWIDNLPLDQAVAKMSQAARTPIKLETEPLQKAGVAVQSTVTLRYRGGLFIDALDELIREMNAKTMEEHSASIDWMMRDGRLFITLSEDANARGDVATRAYDVLHLVPANAPTTAPTGFGSYFGGPSFTNSAGVYDLSRFIQEAIQSDSWRENGGYAGTIRAVGDKIVVVHTLSTHARIRKLLADMSRPVQPEKDAAQISKAPEIFRFHPTLKRWISRSYERGDEQLRKIVPEFKATNLTVGQALDLLSLENDLYLLIADQSADVLAADLLPATRKISVGMRNAPVWQVIREILQEAAKPPAAVVEESTPVDRKPQPGIAMGGEATDPSRPYTWWVDGGLILVGSSGSESLTTRIYNIKPVADALNRASAAQIPPLAALDIDEVVWRLERLVVQDVDADSWRVNGGQIGFILSLGGNLMITHTWEVNEAVRLYLEELRQRPRYIPPMPAGN